MLIPLILEAERQVVPPTPPPAPVSPAPGYGFWSGQQPFYDPYGSATNYDEWIMAIENLTNEGSCDSINIPWLLSLSVSMGNAATEAISRNCVVFCEPEWGFDMTGTGKGSMYGNGGTGTGEGALYVSW